jgi:hypothetical protein
MRLSCYTIVAALVLALSGCGGGNPFVPPSGPYSGSFFVEGVEVGSLSLTTGGGQLAGTGTVEHLGEDIIVSIAAVLDGRDISGSLGNQQRGSGPFEGGFANADTCSGTFSFTDTAQMDTTSGTWAAHLD